MNIYTDNAAQRAIRAKIDALDAVQLAKAVAAMYALPDSFDPIKPADVYSTEATTCTKVITRRKAAWDAGLTTNSTFRQLPANDWGCFVFNDVLRHIVSYDTLPGAASWDYNWCFDLSIPDLDINVTTGSVLDLDPVAGLGVNGDANPHGPILFAGISGERSGLWIDGGFDVAGKNGEITLLFNPIPPAGVATATLYRWRAGQWQAVSVWVADFNGTTDDDMVLSLAESGYYTLTLDLGEFGAGYGITPNPPAFVSVFQTGNTQYVWSHRPANQLFNNLVNVDEYRTMGLGVLLQNEASELNKQGNLVMAQISGNTDWYDALAGGAASNQQFYNLMFQFRSAYSTLLESGGYCFRKPKSDQELEFKNTIRKVGLGNYFLFNTNATLTTATATTSSAMFRLDDSSDYLAFAARSSQVGSGDCTLMCALGELNWDDAEKGFYHLIADRS